MPHSENDCSWCSNRLFDGEYRAIDCPEIDSLKDVLGAKFIILKNCDNLKYIVLNEELKITELDCKNCNSLRYIFYADCIETLICNNCNMLDNIKSKGANGDIMDIPRLKTLEIKNNAELPITIQFQNLESLNCAGSKNISIGPMANLKTLDCSNTNNIIQISNFKNLESLTARNCQQVLFDGVSKLKYIDINMCKQFSDIYGPNFDKLKELDCSNTDIALIHEFLELETLTADNCKNLGSFANNPKLHTVSIYKCEKIVKIYNNNSALRFLDCSHCYNLNEINNIHTLKEIIFYCCTNLDIMNMGFYNIEEKYINPYMNKQHASGIKLTTNLPYVFVPKPDLRWLAHRNQHNY